MDRPESHAPADGARNTGIVYFSAIAMFMALFFWLNALGSAGPSAAGVAKALALALFFLCAPDNIPRPARWNHAAIEASWDSLVILGLLALVAVLGLLSTVVHFPFQVVILVLGPWWCVRSWLRYWHRSSAEAPMAKLLILLLAVWCVGVVYGRGYRSPRFLDVIALGVPQKDMLFHMAITNMIKTYGVPSTGLHGTPYLPYHVGSHFYFAQLSRLFECPTLWVYNLFYPVVFIPLFLESLFLLALCIRRANACATEDIHRATFWGIILVGVAGFVPYMLESGGGAYMQLVNNDYVALSESYNTAMTLGLLVLAVIYAFVHASLEEHKPHPMDLAAGCVLPWLIGLVGVFKISVGLILSALWAYALMRGPWRRRRWMPLSFFFLILADAGLTRFFALRSPAHWSLLALVRADLGESWIPYSLILPTAWSLLFILAMLYAGQATSWKAIREQWRDDRLFDSEIVAVIALASVAPTIFFDAPGNSEIFFFNVQHWVGLAFLLGFWPVIHGRLMADGARTSFMPRTELGKAVGFCAVALVVLTSVLNAMAPLAGVIDDKSLLAQLAHPGSERKAAHASMNNREVLSGLLALDKLSREDKRDTRLFIPPTNRAYWDFFTLGTRQLDTGPFLAPALSGIALVYGVPENPEMFFGYGAYPSIGKTPATLPEVCGTVRAQDAQWLILFQDKPAEPFLRYHCRAVVSG